MFLGGDWQLSPEYIVSNILCIGGNHTCPKSLNHIAIRKQATYTSWNYITNTKISLIIGSQRSNLIAVGKFVQNAQNAQFLRNFRDTIVILKQATCSLQSICRTPCETLLFYFWFSLRAKLRRGRALQIDWLIDWFCSLKPNRTKLLCVWDAKCLLNPKQFLGFIFNTSPNGNFGLGWWLSYSRK